VSSPQDVPRLPRADRARPGRDDDGVMLLPREWTSATGELTPTLKMRRPVIHASFAAVIDELYGR